MGGKGGGAAPLVVLHDLYAGALRQKIPLRSNPQGDNFLFTIWDREPGPFGGACSDQGIAT